MSLSVVILVVWLIHESSAGFFRGQRGQSNRHSEEDVIASGESMLNDFSIPTKCLEDPDSDDCRQKFRNLQRYTIPTGAVIDHDEIHGVKPRNIENDFLPQSTTKPHSYVSDYDARGLATSAPTKDMCYGNMKRYNKKLCFSEMPSVSIEPSEQPTLNPNGEGNFGGDPSSPSARPSGSPSQTPTVLPTPSPTTSPPTPSPTPSTNRPTESGLGQCERDCDTDADCEGDLYCFQRDRYQAVPGCDGMGESDGSRSDYCTSVTPPPVDSPTPPSDGDVCRIQLYWDSSFNWQGSSEEMNWCMICGNPNLIPSPTCETGDNLYIQECNVWQSTYFEFIDERQSSNGDYTTMIQVQGTDLCLERSGAPGIRLSVFLETCSINRPRQRWTVGDLPISCDGNDSEFEIGQPVDGTDLCLTTHHHPKHGEEVELFPCTVARGDDTSLWTTI